MGAVKIGVYMFCLAVLPPLWILWHWVPGNSDEDSLHLVRQTIVLLAWILAIKNIIVPHHIGPLRNVPCAPGDWFILGHGPFLFDDPPGSSALYLISHTENQGLVRTKPFFHLGNQLLLTEPETISEVLNTHCYDYIKPERPTAFLSRITGQGLIIAEGAHHKIQRKAVWPAFQGHVIRDLVPSFWRKAVELVDAVATESGAVDPENAGVGTIEFNGIASRAALDIIGVAGFGKDFHTLQNSGDELAEHFHALTDPSNKDIFRYFLAYLIVPQWLVTRLPMAANRMISARSKRLRVLCHEILAEKRQALQRKTAKGIDILTVLLESQELPDESILDQLLTFLAAGHETIASALTWAVYLLATHQDAQQRLRNEVKQKISGLGPSEMYSDLLESMPYLSAVSNESLRLWPTVPVTSRIAVRDTVISGTKIPQGTPVIIAPLAINRLDKLWGDDALEFKPERWLGEGEKTYGGSRNVYAQITFLHGPRSCVGQSFARAEMKTLLAALVDRFSFEMLDPNEEVSPAGTITIKPRNGLRLRVTDLNPSPN